MEQLSIYKNNTVTGDKNAVIEVNAKINEISSEIDRLEFVVGDRIYNKVLNLLQETGNLTTTSNPGEFISFFKDLIFSKTKTRIRMLINKRPKSFIVKFQVYGRYILDEICFPEILYNHKPNFAHHILMLKLFDADQKRSITVADVPAVSSNNSLMPITYSRLLEEYISETKNRLFFEIAGRDENMIIHLHLDPEIYRMMKNLFLVSCIPINYIPLYYPVNENAKVTLPGIKNSLLLYL